MNDKYVDFGIADSEHAHTSETEPAVQTLCIADSVIGHNSDKITMTDAVISVETEEI